MAVFSHSPVLFVRDDGSPMEFHMRPCKLKNEIKPFIEYGGGILQLTAGPNVIRLVEPGCKLANISDDETVLFVQYIYDCVKKNSILNFKDYRVELKAYDVSDIDEDETQSCVVKCVKKKPVPECKSKPAVQLQRNKVPSSKREQRNCVLSRLKISTYKERKEQQLSNEYEDSDVIEEQSIELSDSNDSDYVANETLESSSFEEETPEDSTSEKKTPQDSPYEEEAPQDGSSEEETTAPILSADKNLRSQVRSVTHNQNTYGESKCSEKMVLDKENRFVSQSVVKRRKESCEDDFKPSAIKKTRKDVKLYDYEQCSLTLSDTIHSVASGNQITDQNSVSIRSTKLKVQQDNAGIPFSNENSLSLSLGLSLEENSQCFGSWNKCTWNSHPNNNPVQNSQSMLENLSNHDAPLLNESGISLPYNDLDQNENITSKAASKLKEHLTSDALKADEVPVLDISSEQDSTPNSLGTASGESFYSRTSSLVKKLADTISAGEGSEIDVLKSINDLNMLLYLKHLKSQVTDILKQKNWSVRDYVVLLKYVSLVYKKSPKEILEDAT